MKRNIIIFFLLIVPNIVFSQTATDFFTKGLKNFKTNDHVLAKNHFTKAIELGFEDAVIYFLRGSSKSKLEDYSGAVIDYTKALNLGFNNSGLTSAFNLEFDNQIIYNNRGFAKLMLFDNYGAIDDLNKAIALDDKDAFAYLYRGFAKQNLSRINEGCLDISKAGERGLEKAFDAIKKFCK